MPLAEIQNCTIITHPYLDLIQLPKQDKYILYCLCEFSGFIKGIVIKNKEATTVLENFEKIWVLQGP